jgi:hypothetical protein
MAPLERRKVDWAFRLAETKQDAVRSNNSVTHLIDRGIIHLFYLYLFDEN